MKCKYCEALLEDGVSLCPVCGKEQDTLEGETAVEGENSIEPETVEWVEEDDSVDTESDAYVEEDDCYAADEYYEEEEEEEAEEEEAEEEEASAEPAKPQKRKQAWWKILLMGIGMLAAVVLFTSLILKSQGGDPNPLHWFGDIFSSGNSGGEYNLKRDDYSAKSTNVEAQAAKIAATSGDVQLDNAQLQVYYWNGVYEFISNYQYYLESLGLDLGKPLNEQTTIDGDTWQKFFLENAIFNWHKFSALVHEANETGFTLSAETAEQLELLAEDMDEYAQSSGYESATDMLKSEMGELVTLEAYIQYCWDYYTAMEYFNAEYEKMQPTDEQIQAYFTEHESELAASGITKTKMGYDVRHILIQPEGGTENEDGATKTYTDAEWAACLSKAEALLDQWKKGAATEESFAELAKTESTDGGSSENGGLYSGLDESTSFVQEFKDWYLDESRKVGDTGIIQSVYGYHIMYFSASGEMETDWMDQCATAILQEKSEKLVEELMEKWPVKVNDKQIALGNVDLQY